MKMYFFFIIFAVLIVSSCSNQPETIKIGSLGPLTGEAAVWGIPAKNGALLAVEEINASGGINGKEIELIIEDDKCEPRDGTNAFRKLVNDNVLGVIGAVCSSVTLAVAPIAEQSKTLLISPASTNPKITTAGDYIFRVIPTDALRGKVFADYIKNDVGLSHVAVLYINNEGGVGNKETFEKEFTALGGSIIVTESYAQGVTDVRSQLTKISKASIQAIVVVSYPEDTIVVLKQIAELGINLPIYFQTEAPDDPIVVKNAGAAAENVTYILPATATGNVANNFRNNYKNKFGEAPPPYLQLRRMMLFICLPML